jgi:hypothetical protein
MYQGRRRPSESPAGRGTGGKGTKRVRKEGKGMGTEKSGRWAQKGPRSLGNQFPMTYRRHEEPIGRVPGPGPWRQRPHKADEEKRERGKGETHPLGGPDAPGGAEALGLDRLGEHFVGSWGKGRWARGAGGPPNGPLFALKAARQSNSQENALDKAPSVTPIATSSRRCDIDQISGVNDCMNGGLGRSSSLGTFSRNCLRACRFERVQVHLSHQFPVDGFRYPYTWL